MTICYNIYIKYDTMNVLSTIEKGRGIVINSCHPFLVFESGKKRVYRINCYMKN